MKNPRKSMGCARQDAIHCVLQANTQLGAYGWVGVYHPCTVWFFQPVQQIQINCHLPLKAQQAAVRLNNPDAAIYYPTPDAPLPPGRIVIWHVFKRLEAFDVDLVQVNPVAILPYSDLHQYPANESHSRHHLPAS